VYKFEVDGVDAIKHLRSGYQWFTPPLNQFLIEEGLPNSLHVFRDDKREILFYVFGVDTNSRFKVIFIYKERI